MVGINTFLRANTAAVSIKRVSVAPDIPESKLNGAVKAFGFVGNPATIIALFDNTLLGSGKDGLLFTGERLIYRAPFSAPAEIAYRRIETAKCKETPKGKSGGKIEKSLELTLTGSGVLTIKDLLDCDYDKLASILQTCTSEFNDYREEKQLIPVEEMSDTLKVAYVKVIVNMAFSSGGTIDERKLAEILLLMTRLNISPDSRFELRAYISSTTSPTPMGTLLKAIETECPEGQIVPVHVSLTKDLMNTHLSSPESSLENFPFFVENRSLLNVSDGAIELIVMAIENDRKMLRPDYTDEKLVAAMKLMSAKAVAVGTPLAAVYLSGSVVGLSAAGITSGLATLGMGGLLGLSSMATGIGVAVLIGVAAYTGVRKLTGADKVTSSKRRELMLNEVIKQTQATISLLIHDINFIVTKLNDVMTTTDRQEAQVRKLMRLMSQMTTAGEILTGRANSAQKSATTIKCARHLSLTRLRSLTREPTKAGLYDFITSFYEETVEISEKDGTELKTLVLKQNCDSQSIERLANAFEAIGYFDAGEIAKGAAIDATQKAKDKLVGFFS